MTSGDISYCIRKWGIYSQKLATNPSNPIRYTPFALKVPFATAVCCQFLSTSITSDFRDPIDPRGPYRTPV